MLVLSVVINTGAVFSDSQLEQIASAAVTIIIENEGSYTSVNANDSGNVDIGVFQWRGTRALNLLKTIVSADRDAALEILGEEFVTEIETLTAWTSRTFDSTEAKAVAELLGTEVGILAQDDLAYTDVLTYINHGISLGIEDAQALVYFADVENQGGSGTSAKIAASAAESANGYDVMTLSDLHLATMETSLGKYTTRRTRTYEYCKSLVFGSSETEVISAVTVSDISLEGCTLTCTATDTAATIYFYIYTETDFSVVYEAAVEDGTATIEMSAADFDYYDGLYRAKLLAYTQSGDICDSYSGVSFTLEDMPVVDSVECSESGYVSVGTEVTWTASASGGTGELTCTMALYLDDELYAEQDGAELTVTLDTEGEYYVIAFARDENGNVAFLDSDTLNVYDPETVEVTNIQYDADGDSEVTMTDARLILRHAIGIEEMLPAYVDLCDSDGDGVVTMSDARQALRLSLGLE